MRNFILASILILIPILSIAETYTITQAPGKTIECTGFMETSSMKTYKISWTTFRNSPNYYTNEIKKGNAVIIINYNGANFQIVKL